MYFNYMLNVNHKLNSKDVKISSKYIYLKVELYFISFITIDGLFGNTLVLFIFF